MKNYSLLAVLLFCMGMFCLVQSHAQVPMTGAGLGVPASGGCAGLCLQSIIPLTHSSVGVTSFTLSGITVVTNQSLVIFAADGTFNHTFAGTPPVWSVGSQTLTQIATCDSTTAVGEGEIWAISRPTAGTGSVTLTVSSADVIFAGAFIFSGANATTASAFLNGGSPTTYCNTGNGGSQASLATPSITSATGHIAIGMGGAANNINSTTSLPITNTQQSTIQAPGGLCGVSGCWVTNGTVAGAATVAFTVTPNIADGLYVFGIDVSP